MLKIYCKLLSLFALKNPKGLLICLLVTFVFSTNCMLPPTLDTSSNDGSSDSIGSSSSSSSSNSRSVVNGEATSKLSNLILAENNNNYLDGSPIEMMMKNQEKHFHQNLKTNSKSDFNKYLIAKILNDYLKIMSELNKSKHINNQQQKQQPTPNETDRVKSEINDQIDGSDSTYYYYDNENTNNKNDDLVNNLNERQNEQIQQIENEQQPGAAAQEEEEQQQQQQQEPILIKRLITNYNRNRFSNKFEFKRDCHLGLGMGHVCHAYTISKFAQKQKLMMDPKGPGRR